MMTDLRYILAERIKSRRRALGLRQVDLAEKLQCSIGQIGHYEAATRGVMVDTLPALATALECSMAYLLGERDSPVTARAYAKRLQQERQRQPAEAP